MKNEMPGAATVEGEVGGSRERIRSEMARMDVWGNPVSRGLEVQWSAVHFAVAR